MYRFSTWVSGFLLTSYLLHELYATAKPVIPTGATAPYAVAEWRDRATITASCHCPRFSNFHFRFSLFPCHLPSPQHPL